MSLNEKKLYNVKTSSEASSYQQLMTSFQFIVVLVITKQLMDYFFPITRVLQTKDFDIAQRNEQIENLKKQPGFGSKSPYWEGIAENEHHLYELVFSLTKN